ncbi:MAG: hypothetical protein K2Y05_00960 [Hyphomicrobiaceae bacterium]|nr:hypothetical protein [Hyphomicrobiaceae bacterium]
MSDRIELDIRPPSDSGPEPLISLIVPLAPWDTAPDRLISRIPGRIEIILARGGTRATSMNRAAMVARGSHLWFVHADSDITADAVTKLLQQVTSGNAALRYFDLTFDGGFAMRITELGVMVRSRVFGMPFGDQAFCLPATSFAMLGGYDETVTYGEDHLLVWSARRHKLPVLPVGATVLTSARKYREQGWFRTTAKHLWLTVKQALPEMFAATKVGPIAERPQADHHDTPNR